MTSAAPFTPTNPNGNIGPCLVCGRHATGLGLGTTARDRKDPRWLCEMCIPLVEHIRSIQKFDMYEHNAVTEAVEAVGPLVQRNGADLSQWDEEQVEEFAREIWLQCGASIRRQVKDKEVPF